MLIDLSKKARVLLWQALFMIAGTSWLWAPQLNPALSTRQTLISQYETPHQPYSWLFRAADFTAGLLVALAARYYIESGGKKTAGILLAIISIGMMADPILTTNCHMVGQTCREYFSFEYVLHAVETVATASAFFAAGIYDAVKRKKLVSIGFTAFQIGYGILFLTQFVDQEHFNTVSQYIYQAALIGWLAWFVRDYLEPADKLPGRESDTIKNLTAVWAFFNGLLAILVSLAHLNLLGRIRGLYFTSNNAWLAQHGMIIGVVMLYLSRHLARGERRARQIFLLIIGIEAIKYAVITPSAGLLALYAGTFILLFLARESFDRGVVPLTWRLRLKDLAYLLLGLLAAAVAALAALDRDNRVSVITYRAVDNFFDYIGNNAPMPHNHLRSILLAHSISAFILAAVFAIMWVLFRPSKIQISRGKKYALVRQMLGRFSRSSEDYFKLWPRDKDFYWGRMAEGFVAYKVVGTTAFGLADPIGPDRAALLNEFSQWCRAHRLKVCCLPVYEKNLSIYKDSQLELMQIGSSAEIKIADFLNTTVKDKWWRWKLNQAKKSGYTYHQSMPPHSDKLMRGLRKVSSRWLSIGGHAERGFALGYFDKDYMNDCAVHYLADQTGKVVAFTNVLPQFHTSKIMTVDLIRYTPEAGNSMPFLLCSLIQHIAEDRPDIEVFDLGFVPFAKAKGPLLHIAKTFSRDRFSSRGLEQFKNKFKPDWRPNYMAYDGDLADLAIIALNIEKTMGQK